MPRLPRLLLSDSPTVYHVISKTALDGLPFDEVDKDDFVRRLKRLALIYFTEILGFDRGRGLEVCTRSRDRRSGERWLTLYWCF